jgi:anti-sigma factor RsiW
MSCREAGEWLSPYLEDELDARRRARLESHLAECARCSGELAMLREAARVLAGPITVARPEGLLAEFKQRLASEAPAPRRPWWTQPWTWSLAGVTATAAAAGLIVHMSGPFTQTAPSFQMASRD